MIIGSPSPSLALDELDKAIINCLQEGFPLVPNPFTAVAARLGCSEQELLDRVGSLRERGVITRFGPFYDAAAMGGAFCLCAMAVPRARFEEVAEVVNSYPEVAHNYERDHDLNMWFVLATDTPERIESTATRIEQETGLSVMRLPKLEEYFIGFKVAA